MESEPTCWFALAAEDTGHHTAVPRLTDRVLEEAIDWFQPATRDAIRRWRTPSPLNLYWKVTGSRARARDLGLAPRGHFDGDKVELEAALYVAQLRLWQHAHVHGQRIDVGFIARDTDHEPRKKGAVQAVESAPWPFKVVLVFPHPEIEAWAIAVFRPTISAERARLEEQTRLLGYSPVEHPERLTSTVPGRATDAKTVRAALLDEAGTSDWVEVDLNVLRERGKSCGLTEFLEDVNATMVGILNGGAVTPSGR